ncbi:MAG: hypothetical protein ABW191_05675 [Aliihoeflea sp.]
MSLVFIFGTVLHCGTGMVGELVAPCAGMINVTAFAAGNLFGAARVG